MRASIQSKDPDPCTETLTYPVYIPESVYTPAPVPVPEPVSMFPRWMAALVLWVGVLGIASPALACATVAPAHRDCCPDDGAPVPCGGEQPGELACCIAAPTPAPAAGVSLSTEQDVQDRATGAPDPVLLVAWLQTLATAPWMREPIEPQASPPRNEATFTYLQTRRLRL